MVHWANQQCREDTDLKEKVWACESTFLQIEHYIYFIEDNERITDSSLNEHNTM